ncbi:FecCD family ABC transporter permease [Naasia aerilata]|uniref:ABC transporter permease n=1 Tax=Naasia aerilata TaxID=1162966 RepID=A0ABN6XR86_9MICO|nr:iron ABC transporter permease [Naasia aerilata]BDZ47527.1 ABC transporter permease [Naasia aerilata]
MTAAAEGASSARVHRRMLGLLLGALGLVVFSALSLLLGSRSVAVPDVIAGLTTWPATDIAQAAVQTRIPRTVLGLIVGASLALAGAVLQGATRNPLADPALLGVSNGAALAVVVGIAVAGAGTAASHVPWALGGAAAASVVVYGIASLGREGATPLKLALAGAATSATLYSLLSGVLLSRTDVLDEFRFWQVGGIGGTGFGEMLPVLPVLLLGAVLAFASARGLDALALGDDVARGLGSRTWIARAVAGLAAVLLCGTATAIAGPIGFLGLTMPHLARMFTGPDHRWLLPYSAVLGAGLLLAADVLGRLVARPGDIEVGIMTAVLGAPVFIAIVRRRRVREL